ncbi:MAG: hypothetical protein P4L33_09935 [Capsulimonadaceae bacterium]|nr:hypothetical protein [Capsulimonadaceae bacterium]
MPENSLKVTRNFRGGAARAVRVCAGAGLLVHSLFLLWRLLDRNSPGFDTALPMQSAAIAGALAGIELLVAIWFLKGTFIRLFGVIVILVMIIPVVLGHVLWTLGLPDSLRRVPLAILLVGCVIVYTGEGEWSLVGFALGQSRQQQAAA